MIPALIGLIAGLGLLMLLLAVTEDQHSARSRRRAHRRRFDARIQELLNQAGIEGVTPGRLVLASLGVGAFAGFAVLVISQSLAIAGVFGAMAAYLPIIVVRRRRRHRQVDLREQWPDVVDNLTSSVRAGLSLPEALAQIGDKGPVTLRPAFSRFAADYRTSGRFGESLDALKDSLSDPVGDRVVEALRVARDVGGSDLGHLLRTLSAFLREDARTRGELEARQTWTVNGARLAVAAPWLLLVLLSLRPEAVRAYDTSAGVTVLVFGLVACIAAYRIMLRIGRLPDERRVLR